MSTLLICEAALYDANDQEITHRNYKRLQVRVSYQDGFNKKLQWFGIGGAGVMSFKLLMAERVIATIGREDIKINGHRVTVELAIKGKGKDAPDPVILPTTHGGQAN